MEIVYSVPTIPCPAHPSQTIQKIDPRPGTPKVFYCSDCILESENPKSLAGSLLSFDQFLNDATLFYTKNQHELGQISDPPVEYTEMISMQGESLDQLTKHVEKQKYIIDDIFIEVKKNILEQIDRKKQEYYQRLDEQVPNVCQLYHSLERDLKRNYPQPEDMSSLYPTKEELEKRISLVQNFSQLDSFIKEVRDDINRGNFNKFNSEEAKKKHFDSLLEELKTAISNQPCIDRNNQEFKLFYDAIQGSLDQLLNKGLIFKNIVPNKTESQKYPESTFVGPEQFKQLRLWLPEKFEFNPRLIYRSSLDGLAAQNFHSKCDGKGSTITFIKCKFQGSQKTSIIGGFIDQSWHQNGWIDSKEAFIFSLTEKIKRNVLDSKRAAFAGSENGPTFGVGHDLLVRDAPSRFYVHPSKSYSLNGEGIINSEVQGPTTVLFNPEEIEVYALK